MCKWIYLASFTWVQFIFNANAEIWYGQHIFNFLKRWVFYTQVFTDFPSFLAWFFTIDVRWINANPSAECKTNSFSEFLVDKPVYLSIVMTIYNVQTISLPFSIAVILARTKIHLSWSRCCHCYSFSDLICKYFKKKNQISSMNTACK